MRSLRTIAGCLVAAALGLAGRTAVASDQVLLTPSPAVLTAGATAQLQLAVQLDTIPLGGYLFTVNYDTNVLTLISLGQVQTGEFQDEFFQGPGAAAGSFTFQGLNDRSLLSPTGGAQLAVAAFQTSASSAAFAGTDVLSSTVTVTAREGVSTNGSSLVVFSGTATFQVLGDTVAPTTTFFVSTGPQYVDGAGALFLSSSTLLAFTAADAAAGSFPPSGVARTEYRVDAATTAAFQPFTAPFSFAEGGHFLEFRSVDRSGNVEAIRARAVKVDATAPTSQVAFSSASYLAASSRTFVAGGGGAILSAQDPVAGGVAAGVAQLQFRLDASTPTSAFQAYASTIALSAGDHVLEYRSVDNVANAEGSRALSVSVDTAPPATVLLVNGLAAGTTHVVVLSTDSIGLAASDGGAGVAQTLYSVDGATSAVVYASTFTFDVGTHTVAFQSLDRVGNVEGPVAVAVTVLPPDVLPPRTALAVGLPRFGAAPIYVSSATPLGLTAVDDKLAVGDGAGLGVAQTLYAVDSGSFTVFSASFTIAAEGPHTLSFYSVDRIGNIEAVRISSIAVDLTPPVSAAALGAPTYNAPDGTLYVATTTLAGLSAYDPALSSATAAGSGVGQVQVAIDTTAFSVFASSFSLAEGRHTILYRAVDHLGNAEAVRSLLVSADATAPVSSIAIGQPQFALSSSTVLVSSLTPIGLSALDPISNAVDSGVRRLFYSIAGSTYSVFSGSFTLSSASGPTTIAYYAQDQVLNTEAVKLGTVMVDATPPSVALLSPGSCPGGLCRVIKGKIPVLGTATDADLASYSLDFAPGLNATTGYVTIAVATSPVGAGALGAWDASRLSGWQTLRLTATDAVRNAASVSLSVFVGDPGESLILGNHGVFDMPQGVASDGAGNIYVADTNADRIAVFTATGAFVTSYGASRETRVSTSTARFKKPKGVALDAAGNLYVADTEDDRIVKLSTSGQVLFAIGRTVGHDGKGRDKDDPPQFVPGKGLGEFNKPSGLALGPGGLLYVSDTDNNRVQVLSSTGGPILAFALPSLPRIHGDDRHDHDSDDPTLGRPFGIASDAAGRIYVADPAGSRALVFGATGQLLLTIPVAGTAKDGHVMPGRPEGIAVSTDGYCLLVSDHKFDRILKFDALGNQTLAFGGRGKYRDGRTAAAIVFHKPAGLSLAADGTLLVADRNDDRVERFGLPMGKTLIVPASSADDDRVIARDVLDSDSGGTVQRADKAGVSVPAGALGDDLKITVSTMSPDSAAMSLAMSRRAEDNGLAPAYAPVEYGPEGTRFTVPVTIVQPYDPSLIAEEGISEDSLAIQYWNKDKGAWEALESAVDKNAHTVTAKTPHFSVYQVLGSTGTAIKPLATADPTFTLHAAYVFPSPVRNARSATIRIQPGLADSVEVHVYDLSGRRVHSSSDFTQSVTDDGNGLGSQYTYDHVWDVSGVGSGVYMYVITARKSGMKDLHKSGKVGVIK